MISYHLKCKDLGFESCDYVAVGNSEGELMRRFITHIITDHEQDYHSMNEMSLIDLQNNIKKILESQKYYYV